MTNPFAKAAAKGASHLAGFGILIFFCLWSVWIWRPASHAAPVIQTAAGNDLTTRLAQSQDRLKALIEITAQRPVFQATRTPVAAPEAPAAAVAPKPTLTLVGILGEQGSQIALVRISTSMELYRVETGSRLASWQFLNITDHTLEVSENNDDPFVLTIGE